MSILTYKAYQGRFEYDPDADIFHGEILHINDVITFQGRSIDELKAALAESVELYLEYCRKKGRKPEKPFKGSFNVRVGAELHRKAALAASVRGVSLNALVEDALRQAVSQ